MPIIINGTPVEADEFAFDGCHKIYLITNAADRQEMIDCGYEGMIYPIKELPAAWEDSCFLRFIGYADLSRPYPVNQGDEDVTVKYQKDTDK